MKKIFWMFLLFILLSSCYSDNEKNNKVENNVNSNIVEKQIFDEEVNIVDIKDKKYEVRKENWYSILFLFIDWDESEIDRSEWRIENVEFINDYLIYEWISTGWMIKKVYDINNKKEVTKLNFWIITEDQKFIYSCEEWGYWPWYIKVFEFSNLTEKNISNDLWIWKEWIIVKECNYENKKIIFNLSNGSTWEVKWDYTYDFITKKLEENNKY